MAGLHCVTVPDPGLCRQGWLGWSPQVGAARPGQFPPAVLMVLLEDRHLFTASLHLVPVSCS